MGSQEDETKETLDAFGNSGSFDCIALQSFSVAATHYTSAHSYEDDNGRQVHEKMKTSVFFCTGLIIKASWQISLIRWCGHMMASASYYISSHQIIIFSIAYWRMDRDQSLYTTTTPLTIICSHQSRLLSQTQPMITSTMSQATGDDSADDHILNDDPSDTKKKKQRINMLTLQKGSTTLPILHKHANTLPRKNQEYCISESRDAKGKTLVTWQNDSRDTVNISI